MSKPLYSTLPLVLVALSTTTSLALDPTPLPSYDDRNRGYNLLQSDQWTWYKTKADQETIDNVKQPVLHDHTGNLVDGLNPNSGNVYSTLTIVSGPARIDNGLPELPPEPYRSDAGTTYAYPVPASYSGVFGLYAGDVSLYAAAYFPVNAMAIYSGMTTQAMVDDYLDTYGSWDNYRQAMKDQMPGEENYGPYDKETVEDAVAGSRFNLNIGTVDAETDLVKFQIRIQGLGPTVANVENGLYLTTYDVGSQVLPPTLMLNGVDELDLFSRQLLSYTNLNVGTRHAYGGASLEEVWEFTWDLRDYSGGFDNLTISFANFPVSVITGLSVSLIDLFVPRDEYTGQSSWVNHGSGSWGTFDEGFGENWSLGDGSPGLDPFFPDVDTATFGEVGSGTVALDGAFPSLKAITFDNGEASYHLTQGSSGVLTLDGGDDLAALVNLAGDHTISAPLVLATDTAVTVLQQGDRLVIAGPVNGQGGLVVNGNGQTVLSQAANYFGDTVVESGSFNFRGAANSAVVLNGGVTSLGVSGTTTTVAVESLELNGGTLVVDLGANDQSDSIEAAGAVDLNDETHFVFRDAGFAPGLFTLITSEAGLFSGETGNLTFSSNIANLLGRFGATEDGLFFRAWLPGAAIFSPVLSNLAPYLVPVDANFVVDGEVVTLSGEPAPVVGSLAFNAGSHLDVADTVWVTSGELEVDSGSALVSGGALATLGDFEKTGEGTLEIGADAALLSDGTVAIEEGKLTVNGLVEAADGVVIAPGAVFAGNSQVNGDLFNFGTLAPGNSPGTTVVAGNYVQLGNFQLEIENFQILDRLIVGGTATLGGTLEVLPWAGRKFKYGQKYTFLHAGRIEGRFDRVLVPHSGHLRGRFVKEGRNGHLLIAPRSYQQVAENRNQREVAGALDRFISARKGDRATVSLALDHLSEGQFGDAFDQIAPTAYDGLVQIVLDQAHTQHQIVAQRIDTKRPRGFSSAGLAAPVTHDRDGTHVVSNADGSASVLEQTAENRWGVWAQGTGIFSKHSRPENRDKTRSGGFLVGADYQWSDQFTTGLFAGYQGLKSKYGNGGHTSIDSSLFGGYAHYEQAGFHGNLIVSGGTHHYDLRRPIRFSNVSRTAHAEPNGSHFNTYLDLGYDFTHGNLSFGPILAAQYSYASVSGFTESGADSLNLRIDRQHANSLRSQLGARIAYTAEVSPEVVIVPEVRAFWQHEYLNTSRDIAATLDGGSGGSFNYETSSPGRDSLVVTAGATAYFGNDWSVNLSYHGDLGRSDRNHSHSVTGGIGWQF